VLVAEYDGRRYLFAALITTVHESGFMEPDMSAKRDLMAQLRSLEPALKLAEAATDAEFFRAVWGQMSIGSLIRDLADVEENWVRSAFLRLEMRHPFGSRGDAVTFYGKAELIEYVTQVRLRSEKELARFPEKRFDDLVEDVHDGQCLTVWQIWAGIAASSSWHCRQIIRLSGLIREGVAVI
jgi:hypothetical protein